MLKLKVALNLIEQPSESILAQAQDMDLDVFVSEQPELPKLELPLEDQFDHIVAERIQVVHRHSYFSWVNNLQILERMAHGTPYDLIITGTDLTWASKFIHFCHPHYVYPRKVLIHQIHAMLPDYSTYVSEPATAFTVSLLWKTLRYWDIKKILYGNFKIRFKDNLDEATSRMDAYLWHMWCVNQSVRIR